MKTKQIGRKLTKKVIREYLREKLSTDKKWALHALEAIYDYQTSHEQELETTNEENGVGFSGADAEILTSFAKQYETRKYLSPKQMEIVYKKMKKYWKQVLAISNEGKLQRAMIEDGAVTKEQVFLTNLLK